MLSSRFGRALAAKPAAVASTPNGMRVYVIGDVHGRNDLLSDLAEQIERDCATATGEVVTVLLGDYVDRGPQSAAVVERLSANRFPTALRALRGNHEAMFLEFLDNPKIFKSWRRFGGLETLSSYRVDVSKAMRGEGYEAAHAALVAALPAPHRHFLETTELSATIGDYFFCHAGVRPGTPLALQSAEDLMWMREEFLSCEQPFGKIVVHGHTPVNTPEIKPNRINIDTGAFATSLLTCLVLEGERRRFLAAIGGSERFQVKAVDWGSCRSGVVPPLSSPGSASDGALGIRRRTELAFSILQIFQHR